jgi:ABC-type molybdate transport system substrate-binding protein
VPAPTAFSRKVRRTVGAPSLARRSGVRLMGRENNYVDLASSTYGFDTTGSITLLATIAQGASVSQRIGKKVVLKSLQMRGTMYSAASTTIADAAYIIVYDRRPTGTLPNITDVLDSNSPFAFNKDDNAGRFKILKRVDRVFCGNTTTITAKSGYAADMWMSLRNLPVTFKSAGTGAIGDIEEGALYLITLGNGVEGSGTGAILQAGFRVRYKDV